MKENPTYKVIFSFLLLSGIPLIFWGQTSFVRTYGLSGSADGALYATQSSNGNIAILTDGNSHWSMLRVNSDGNSILGSTSFHAGTFSQWPSGLYKINNGGGGYIISGASSNQDLFITKLNAAGAYQWNNSFNGTNGETMSPGVGTTAIQTSEGGFAFACTLSGYSMGTNVNSVMLVKTTAAGALSWSKIYGSSGSPSNAVLGDIYAYDVYQTTDNGYIITGYGYKSCGVNCWADDVVLIKTTSAGNFSWWKAIGKTGSNGTREEGHSVTQTPDGGYLIAGSVSSSSYGPAAESMYLIKTDSNGSPTWEKAVGGSGAATTSSAWAVTTATDGDYIIAGYSNAWTATKDIFMVKVNSSAVLQWATVVGTTANDGSAVSIERSGVNDGSFIVSADAGANVAGKGNALLIKIAADGSINNSFGGGGGCSILTVTPTITNITTANSASPASIDWLSYGAAVAGDAYTGEAQSPQLINCNGGNPLPIVLLSLDGNYADREIKLDWATATEQNSDYFIIERNKGNGTGEWESVGKVNGAGNSNYTLHYDFFDTDLPPPDTKTTPLYYRLKQFDYNGEYTYYGPIAVDLRSKEDIFVHTSPTNEQLLVSFPENLENKNCSVKIFDLSGRTCFSNAFIPNKYKNEMWINCSEWSKGVYIISACSENGTAVQKKFVKQ